MSLFGDLFGGGSASRGARQAGQTAQNLQERAYGEMQPWRDVGKSALRRLESTYITGETPYEASPGYGFRFDEGQRAIERAMAARGLGRSGRLMRELTRYGQGMAAQDYNQEFNRLAALAGAGQSAAGQSASVLMQPGAAPYQMARGQARQSAYGDTMGTLAGLGGLAMGRYG